MQADTGHAQAQDAARRLTIGTVDRLAAQRDLLALNWRETGIPGASFEPILETYQALEAAGLLLVVLLEVGDEIRGYTVGLVAPHPQSAGHVIYNNEACFVAPDARAGGGLELLRFTEAEAKARGAVQALWHAKRDSAMERILDARGLRVHELIYAVEV